MAPELVPVQLGGTYTGAPYDGKVRISPAVTASQALMSAGFGRRPFRAAATACNSTSDVNEEKPQRVATPRTSLIASSVGLQKVDCWACGVFLYAMLFSDYPFGELHAPLCSSEGLRL